MSNKIREVAKQEERNRLARELHDSIKQQIFVIQTAAATAQARFDGDQAGARQALGQIRSSAREVMTEMQVMLDQLRAVPLENAGLMVRSAWVPEALPPGTHEAILRASQEALANVGRHACAGVVLVSLGSVSGHVELRIRDDGAGFDPSQCGLGQGIANMRARAEEFGGRFELVTAPGGGTSIEFSILYTVAEAPLEYRRRAVACWRRPLHSRVPPRATPQ